MAAKRKPCTIGECGRPKMKGSTKWCYWHWLDRQTITVQVAEAQGRLARSEHPAGTAYLAVAGELPQNTSWCLDCQSLVPAWYRHNGKRCRACEKARTHGKHLEKTYGVTGDQYAAKLAEQGGRCAICLGRPRSKRLAQDHDHKTGAVRGLLCSRCNHDLLGAAHDSVEILERAVAYLKSYGPGELAPAAALRADLSAPTGCTDDPPF